VTVLLPGASRAASAPSSVGGSGRIVGANFIAIGNVLGLEIHLSVPSNVDVAVGTGASLAITAHAAGSQPRPTARPSPSATELPESGGAFSTPLQAPGEAPSSPSPTGTRVIEVVPLKYADVSEVVGILVPGAGQGVSPNDTFSAQTTNIGNNLSFGGGVSGALLGGSTFGGALSTGLPNATNATLVNNNVNGQGFGQRVNDNVAIDRRLNAIVLFGTPDIIAAYKDAIAKIDQPLSSVLLETQIVELDDNAAKDLGIDLANGGRTIATATYDIKSGQLPTGTISFAAAVYAQINTGHGKLLAKPRVLALNGTSASILTGDAIPVPTSIVVSGVNAVQQQVQYVNVGVNLQIQPRISSDGYVTSHVFSEVSSVTAYVSGFPQISQRQAYTSATVKDGESFVVGGLLQQTEISNLQKLPFLGDLPILGGLFRVRHDSHTLTNLYIIVTPHIVTKGM
jgi:general secretion pathway protein D